ncbi:sulfotransferase family protein [Rhodovulum sp. YNF3179]|uniref:sulfotransferase family protein n=1 Tax=Rhodovulum sp. YNF3179 TaxID=3425127 RepID=UPI003D34EACD
MTLPKALPFTPVIIIGAARSGTNALRDALTELPGFETWPCDEINPIWRHGNLRHPDDELPAGAARPEVCRYVRRSFERIWRRCGRPAFVVEKTCANSLRVPFVDAILPEAVFLYIVRDGVDVVASARKRWLGELEVPGLSYFLAKARFAPPGDLPVYATAALSRRIAVSLGRRKHLGVWGPRFADMDRYYDAPVEELCARQWAACVGRADAALSNLSRSRVISVRYEDLADNPSGTLNRILERLGTDLPSDMVTAAAGKIHGASVGKGRNYIENLQEIMPILEVPLMRHGYS